MARGGMVILEQDHAEILSILTRLQDESNSKLVFLLDKNGQQIANSGDLADVDPTSLASLAAGNVAATEGLAQLIGEPEFSTLFHEGEEDSLHISLIANKVILLVIFDQHSSLGLVRLRVKQRTEELTRLVRQIVSRDHDGTPGEVLAAAPLGEITDEDIDQLFG